MFQFSLMCLERMEKCKDRNYNLNKFIIIPLLHKEWIKNIGQNSKFQVKITVSPIWEDGF